MLAGSYCRMPYYGNVNENAAIIETIHTQIVCQREMPKKTVASRRGRRYKRSYSRREAPTQKDTILAQRFVADAMTDDRDLHQP